MKNGKNLKKYSPALAAAVMAGALLTLFFHSQNRVEKVPADVVLIGDSIIGRQAESFVAYPLLGEMLGADVYNCAFGGNRASLSPEGSRIDNTSESLSLVKLTESICRKDFAPQAADIVSNREATRVNYFEDHLHNLQNVDFSRTKVLVLEFGTNDYNSGHPADDPEDPYNLYTFGGAMRSSIERIQETYPEIQLILVTPTFCRVGTEMCDRADFGGGTLNVYAEKVKELGEAYGLPVADVYTDMDINENNVDRMTLDGVHLTEEGHAVYCEILADIIRQYL